jgi:hypothetical protein
MINEKLIRYRTNEGCHASNKMEYANCMSLIADKNHFIYFLNETYSIYLYNHKYDKKGLDIIGYKLAKFSWRHNILYKIDSIFDEKLPPTLETFDPRNLVERGWDR